MKKYLTTLVMIGVLPLTCAAADNLTDLYFSDKNNPKLTAQEKAGIAIANRWRASSATGMKPVPGPEGSISFAFGVTQPSVVCAVMQVCDVELQAGEQVNSINLGDTARWSVDPAITGYGQNEVQHLIIKPRDVGLETSLVVTTNRRTYHLSLRSHRTQFMPRVVFTYPDEDAKKWAAIQRHKEADIKEKTIPETGEYMGNLSFGYKIEGDGGEEGRWKPLRVYNDGVKTIIQMPSTMAQTEAPTLLVVRGGGLFSSAEEVMVNYRVQGDRFIVDSVFDKAILIAGVGQHQERVTIVREK